MAVFIMQTDIRFGSAVTEKGKEQKNKSDHLLLINLNNIPETYFFLYSITFIILKKRELKHISNFNIDLQPFLIRKFHFENI